MSSQITQIKSRHPTKSYEVLMSHCGQEKELRDVRKAMLKFISRNIPERG
jgi:hypothetical protein